MHFGSRILVFNDMDVINLTQVATKITLPNILKLFSRALVLVLTFHSWKNLSHIVNNSCTANHYVEKHLLILHEDFSSECFFGKKFRRRFFTNSFDIVRDYVLKNETERMQWAIDQILRLLLLRFSYIRVTKIP